MIAAERDRPLSRATDIIADSRAIGAARSALGAFDTARIESRAARCAARLVAAFDRVPPGQRQRRVVFVGLIAAVVHVALSAALPAAAVPTRPITAATIVAAIIALAGRR